ncbi:Snt1p PWA37_002770 [Arxiozyma heterogenica]|uniref:Snt1p n=1 Tax=Arxiozyma heterogenica TaxID=278026 RepID=UPI002F20401C
MGYPPPPRHMSDKKRYYYNSNPNRRYAHPYVNNKYSKPFNNSNTINNNSLYSKEEHLPNSSTSIGYSGSNIPAPNLTRKLSSQKLDSPQPTSFKTERPRQSRYSGAIKTTTTTPLVQNSSNVNTRTPISRYNADSEPSTHGREFSLHYRNNNSNNNNNNNNNTNSVTNSKQHHYSSYNETDLKFSTPGKSRFERNKYSSATSLFTYNNNNNSSSNANSGNTTSNNVSIKNSSIMSPIAVSSRYNNSVYSTPNTSSYHAYPSTSANNYIGSRYRPRSAGSSVNSIPLASRDFYSTTNNTTSSSGPTTTTTPTNNYTKDEFPRNIPKYNKDSSSIHDNKNTPNCLNEPSTQWHGTRTINGTMYHSKYFHEDIFTAKSNISQRGSEKLGLERDTNSATPPLSRYNPNVDLSEVSKSKENQKTESLKQEKSKSETFDTNRTITNDSKLKQERRNSINKIDPPSLIHSVAQTTKEVEKQLSIDHKRIDLSRRNSDLNISHQHSSNTTENEIQTKNISNSVTDLTIKNEETNERPQLKTMWTSSDLNLPALLSGHTKEDQDASINQESDQDISEEKTVQPPSETDYEYVCNSQLLKPSLKTLQDYIETKAPLPKPLKPLQECIFPMKETELKLWTLKNQTRSKIIQDQKYLLKMPISSLKEYPFITSNYTRYLSSVKPILVQILLTVKKKEVVKSLIIKKKANELKIKWDEENKELYEISAELRKKEIEYKKAQEERNKEHEQNDKYANQSTELPDLSDMSSNRRRNRADFVDDTEMENVLLQIDPEYKHFQAAAIIPPLHLNHIKRNVVQFQNVNNLVTDKDKWASRILSDKDDNFTEHEHILFTEGYLMYPKKFGKISHYMGGLRTPEECVLHYYRTKKNVNYKELLLQKSKKRKENIAKRRKKKEKELETRSPKITSSSTFNKEQNCIIHGSDVVSEETTSNSEQPLESPSSKEETKMKTEESKDDKTSVIDSSQISEVTNNVNEHSAQQDKVLLNPIPIDNDVSERKKSQNNAVKNKPEDIGDKDVIAIASAAVKTIKEVPALEKFDTLEEPEDTTTEITSVSLENNEFQNRNKKRTYSNSILNEKSIDSRVEQIEGNTTQIMEHRSISNPGVSKKTEDTVSLNTARNSDISIKSNENFSKKKHKYMSDHKTSYWSVREAQIFPDLLRRYGSQWSLISENLTTKSTTMVKNYYQRNAAQNGWKTIVEEADFRKDRENNKSLQQTQFMLQQNTTNNSNNSNNVNNSHLPIISNGVPTQQKPAMLFFDKQSNSAPSIIPPRRSSVFSEYNKDIFSNSPLDELPKPRLPSILFPNTKPCLTNESGSMARNEGIGSFYSLNSQQNTHSSPQETTSTNTTTTTQLPRLSSSVFDFMGGNTEKRDDVVLPKRYTMPNSQIATTLEPSLGKNISTLNNSILHGQRHDIASRENDTILTTESRRNSITALLNPISQHTRRYGTGILSSSSANESMSRTTLNNTKTQLPSIQNTTASHHNQSPTITLQPISNLVGSNIYSTQPTTTVPSLQNQIPDFANDPLAALAAVASAPETLASILPEYKEK